MNGNCGECDRRYHCEVDPAECDNLSGPVTMTNADKIRAMTDEDLADYLNRFCHAITCCIDCPLYSVGCPMLCGAANSWIEWLQQPAENDDAGG